MDVFRNHFAVSFHLEKQVDASEIGMHKHMHSYYYTSIHIIRTRPFDQFKKPRKFPTSPG